MGDFIQESLKPHMNFWVYVILMMIGLWALIAKNNLIKKLMGLAIFQTAIILLYVSLGVKEGASIPILEYQLVGVETGEGPEEAPKIKEIRIPEPAAISNPLPHVLMLTAIVVGVATLGVALALCQMIFKEFGSIEEDEVLRKIKGSHTDD